MDLKFDNAGLCFDKAGEFTDHWWERAFNNAADNLNVQNFSQNVLLSLKDSESIKVVVLYYSVCIILILISHST